MKLLKLADRTVSVLGILLFGILTGLSLFSTIYYSTQYNEPPRQISDLFFVVLVVCATFLFFMYAIMTILSLVKDIINSIIANKGS